MDAINSVTDIGQLAMLVAILYKLFFKNGEKTDKLMSDVAVLQEKTKDAQSDHDKLVLVEAAVKAAHQRLDDIKNQKECSK